MQKNLASGCWERGVTVCVFGLCWVFININNKYIHQCSQLNPLFCLHGEFFQKLMIFFSGKNRRIYMLQFAQQIFNQIRTACGIICTLKHFEEKKCNGKGQIQLRTVIFANVICKHFSDRKIHILQKHNFE